MTRQRAYGGLLVLGLAAGVLLWAGEGKPIGPAMEGRVEQVEVCE